MLEQRCIIEFLLKDRIPPKDILDRLNKVYREDASKLEMNAHTTARKLGLSLGVSP
jgi:hypothetical protein